MDTINIKINGNSVVYEKNTMLYDISKDFQNKNSILGAKINNSLVPLNYRLKKDCEVEFIDFCDLAGYKMYQAGLKFIFEVALKDTYQNMEVRFEHSVPKGMLAEVTGDRVLTNDDIAKIKGAMAKIIDEDIKFEKFNIEKKDMIDFYIENNQSEKARNILNISDEVVSIYKLKEHLNFFYTMLPYSTKSINKFDMVYLGKNRIIFLFPSARTNGQIPEYVHYDNIINSFLEGKEWLKKMKVPYLADLNQLVSECKISDLIEANELLFEKKISSIVDEITSNKDKKIILISGPSSSGKTTTMKRLSAYLKVKGLKPVGISIDDYFVDRDKTPKDENGDYDYECLLAIDIKQFDTDLKALLNGEEIKNINDWIRLFDSLILVIQKYQRGELSKKEESENKKREKIIQQKLVKEFNEKSNYFAYDIEYSMEGVSDYVLDSNGKPIKTEKDNYRVKSLGRADIMLISKPINNKIKIYSMEIKEGTGALGGVLPNKSENENAPSFGSGIAGHLKNNVAIINCARQGKAYIIKDGKKKFDIRKTLLEEIKYCLHFYNRFKLLKNKNFNHLKDIEIDKLELVEEDNSVELVFFLGNYKYETPSSFENHLGILGDPEKYSEYAVKKLLNNKKSDEIDLDYIKYEDLFDFKVLKTAKTCKDNNFDLDIENYDVIEKTNFKD